MTQDAQNDSGPGSLLSVARAAGGVHSGREQPFDGPGPFFFCQALSSSAASTAELTIETCAKKQQSAAAARSGLSAAGR